MNLYLVNEALHARLGRKRCQTNRAHDWQSNALRMIVEAGDEGASSVTLAKKLHVSRHAMSSWLSGQKDGGILDTVRVTGKTRWVRA
jgi:hypothetical protein